MVVIMLEDMYIQKKNPRDIEEFSYSFVIWMLKNAWGKEF